MKVDKLLEAMAKEHYEAVNLRVHGSVYPKWELQSQERKDWFIADMRAALNALVKASKLTTGDLELCACTMGGASHLHALVGDDATVTLYDRAVVLLRALADAVGKENT